MREDRTSLPREDGRERERFVRESSVCLPEEQRTHREEPNVALAVTPRAGECGKEARQKARTHHLLRSVERVLEHHDGRRGRESLKLLLADEAISDRLGQAELNPGSARAPKESLTRRLVLRAKHAREGRRDRAHAAHARHLFDEIDLAHEIGAMRRNRELEDAVRQREPRAPKPRQDPFGFFRGYLRPEELIEPRRAKTDDHRRDTRTHRVDHARHGGASRDMREERCGVR
jgi:hypothetical protein